MSFNFDIMNTSNERPEDLSPEGEIIEEDEPVNQEREPGIFQIKEKIKKNKELDEEEEKILMREFEIVMAVVKKQEEIERLENEKKKGNLSNEEEIEKLSEEEEKINDEGGEIILLVAEATDKGLISIGREMNGAISDMPEIKRWHSGELSEEEKMDEIEERKGKIEDAAEEMGIELKDNIGEIEDQIEEFKDSLEEKYRGYAKMENDLNQIHGASVEEGEGIREMKKTLSSLKGIYKNQLHIEYLEYWKKYKEDPELLLKSHAERNLLMSNWETLTGGLEAAEKGEEEVLKAWVKWVKRHPEITLAALALAVAAGVTAGVLLYPEVMAALATIGGDQVTEEVIKELGPEVVETAAKTSLWVAGKGLLVAGIGTAVGVGILGKVLSWISDEKNRDSLIEGICGAKISGLYDALGGKRAVAKKTD